MKRPSGSRKTQIIRTTLCHNNTNTNTSTINTSNISARWQQR